MKGREIKIKYANGGRRGEIIFEITTGLFSWREHHISGLLARPSPYLKI
jgi:hypothetical protein